MVERPASSGNLPMPNTGLHTSYNLSHLILTMMLCRVYCYDPHFANEKTKVKMIHSWPRDIEKHLFLALSSSFLALSHHILHLGAWVWFTDLSPYPAPPFSPVIALFLHYHSLLWEPRG